MKALTLALVVLLWPLRASGQVAAPQEGSDVRTVTLAAGVGNAMGWLGAQAEGYVRGGRISVFGGLGYTPAVDPGDPSGLAVAAGVRGFTSGQKHRAFLELSVSQVGMETFRSGTETLPGPRVYGPGVQVGYQYVGRGGLTGLASVGVGYGVGTKSGVTRTAMLAGLGLGYTWRR